MAKRRSIKKHTARNILIAVVAIVLIVAIALGIFYAVAPDKFNEYKEKFFAAFRKSDPPATQPTLEGTLEMTVIDIGQGDCIFLQFPDGQTMIMDAGSEFGSQNTYGELKDHLELRGVTSLDYVFITHSDYDHIRYVPDILADYEVENIYIPRVAADMSATWEKTVKAIQAETYTTENGDAAAAEVHYTVGDFVISGKDWTMNCHSYPEEDYPNVKQSSSAEIKNSVSPVCFLEYADRTIVLTGDSNERNEEYLIERGVLDVDADVLKVGHHGSKTSTIDGFLDAVDCEYAIVSYGADNEYGHPTPELMGRLENYRDVSPDDDYNGFKYVYETAKDGNVSVFIDGDGTLRIDGEKTNDKDFSLAWGAAAASVYCRPWRRYEVEIAA